MVKEEVKLDLTELVIPMSAMDVEYLGLAVLYHAYENKPRVRKAIDKDDGTHVTTNLKLKHLVYTICPANKSLLMDLVVRTNICEPIIRSKEYNEEQKIVELATLLANQKIVRDDIKIIS